MEDKTNRLDLPLERFEAIYREWEAKADLREDVERHLAERARYHLLLDKALAATSPGARAIELGCGTAIDTCILAARHPQIRFFAVDIAAGSLALAQRVRAQTERHLHLARADVFSLPLPSETFSLVFHQGLVEHFPEPEGMIREGARLLERGGTAVISVPQTFTGYTLMKRRRIHRATWPWGWERSYTAEALEDLGRRAGLIPVARRGEGYWRSWTEPAWVLRDLYGKFHRRNPLRALAPFRRFEELWDGAWKRAEERLGHRFCKNLIVVFHKP